MLHFEAVIGKVAMVLSTFFLCVLTTLWMTIVSLTVTSECNIMFESSFLANP